MLIFTMCFTFIFSSSAFASTVEKTDTSKNVQTINLDNQLSQLDATILSNDDMNVIEGGFWWTVVYYVARTVVTAGVCYTLKISPLYPKKVF